MIEHPAPRQDSPMNWPNIVHCLLQKKLDYRNKVYKVLYACTRKYGNWEEKWEFGEKINRGNK